MNVAFYGYLAAGVAYSFFAMLLLFSWHKSLQGKLLFIVMSLSAGWALVAAQIILNDESYLMSYQVLEVLRYIAWYIFLLNLFGVVLSGSETSTHEQRHSYQKFIHWALPVSVGFAFIVLLNEIMASAFTLPGQFVFGIAGNVVLALIGLAIIEQLFRNTSVRHRWAAKYLFFGAGGIFIFDFYLYADALLFRSVDQELWALRGIVHVAAIPLLAISSVRNEKWSLNIFVSREIILNTSVFLGGGLYLLLMAAAGYYLKEFGGDWGEVGQAIVLIVAVVVLFVILTSVHLRAKARVFLSKHFYKNKYDYRVEWLRLTDDLKVGDADKNHYKTVIQAMANIVDARAGALWLVDNRGEYKNVEVWLQAFSDKSIEPNDSLIKFLSKKGFVINVKEVARREKEYIELLLPKNILEDENAWLVVPLHGVTQLQGFVVLANPLVERSINWEDRDLLKTAARQITSYLAVLATSAQLAEAKQFEVFSRLSAYMVHDLKNIAAELDLIAINSKKHLSNPEFVKDAFATVDNAASDINRLLAQLRNRRAEAEKKVEVNLAALVSEVVDSKKHLLPAPVFEVLAESGAVYLEKQRLMNVLAHLIDNAQQATADDGEISITVSRDETMHIIEIIDTGCGMDKDFIRNRLFRPFDTTKGNAGMGIGMYESREFIRYLKGDVHVQSKSGKGTIITLQVPLHESLSNGEND